MALTIKQARVLARSLAVEYNAYLEASDASDQGGIIVWGGLLLETQAAIGVQIADPENVTARVDNARRLQALAA